MNEDIHESIPADDNPLQAAPEAQAPEAAPEAPVSTETPEAPETAAETPPEIPKQDDRTVPLAALNEARHTNRELRQQLDAMKPQLDGLTGLRGELEEYRNQNRQQTEQEQFQQDPLGTLRNEIQDVKQGLTAQQANDQAQAQQAQQLESLRSAVSVQIEDFTKTQPDYQQALEHLMTTRRTELEIMGVPASQIPEALNRETIGIAASALQNGQSAPEQVYQMAKLRGYQPAAPATPTGAPAPQATAADNQLDQIAKGQDLSTTMPSGTAAGEALSLSDVERMSDEQFDKWWKDNMKGG